MPSAHRRRRLGLRRRARRALLQRHPRFDLVAVTSRSDAGAPPRRPLPAPPRAARRSRSFDLERHGQVDAAIVAYPHGAAAPVVAALRERGVKVVDLSRRLPPARPATSTSDWYGAHAAPELHRRGASTGCPSCAATQIAGADLVANPGCYPTATLLALAPLARAGCSTTS